MPSPIKFSNGYPRATALVSGDIPNNSANTTGTAGNITATSNSTLTTLSALSLPGSQVSGNISGNAAGLSSTLAIGSGGTGATSLSTGAVLIGGVSSIGTVFSSTQYLTLQAQSSGTPIFAALPLNQSAAVSGQLAIANGGTGVSSATITPTASAFAGWDTNKNLSANNLIDSYTSTATAAGTTTLTVGSACQQSFTGTTTQTVVLPVATTLANGQAFIITNFSTGVVTVQTSGSNVLQAMAANTQLIVTCINTGGGTGTASWNWTYVAIQNALAGGGGSGGFPAGQVTVNSTSTLTTGQNNYVVIPGSSSITITLPASPGTNAYYYFSDAFGICTQAGAVVLSGGSNNINGRGITFGTSFTVYRQFACFGLLWTGSEWLIV